MNEPIKLPKGFSLEMKDDTGKVIQIDDLDQVRVKIAEANKAQAEAAARAKEAEEANKKEEEYVQFLLQRLGSIWKIMTSNNRGRVPDKDINHQLLFFINEIFLPVTMPGKKCIIEPVVRGRFTVCGKLISEDCDGINAALVSEEEYEAYWKKWCCKSDKKMLAGKSDLKKIKRAIDQGDAQPRGVVSNVTKVLLSQLILEKKGFNVASASIAINTFLDYIKEKYGVDLVAQIVTEDSVDNVFETLNKIIRFVNKKFNKNIKVINANTKTVTRVFNVCVSILKLLKTLKKESKKTSKKK